MTPSKPLPNNIRTPRRGAARAPQPFAAAPQRTLRPALCRRPVHPRCPRVHPCCTREQQSCPEPFSARKTAEELAGLV